MRQKQKVYSCCAPITWCYVSTSNFSFLVSLYRVTIGLSAFDGDMDRKLDILVKKELEYAFMTHKPEPT